MHSAHTKLHRFHGGLRLHRHKEESLSQPVQTAPIPDELVLPVLQHIGDPAEPVVKPGDQVYRGQVIAQAFEAVSVPLHAPTSGTVTAIEPRPIPHPSGLAAECIIIKPDFEDKPHESLLALQDQPTHYQQLPAEELRQLVRQAGLVGLGGATFPTFIKLNPGMRQSIDTLIINGAECEPWITCDNALMQEQAGEIIEGIRILMHLLNARECKFGIEDDMTLALNAMRTSIERVGESRIEIVPLPTRYPAGGEKQIIKVLTGKEVPHDGLPIDIGVICHNVGTVHAVYQAIVKHEPLTTRIVTITGPGISQGQNFEAMLGTPVKHLIELAGGYKGKDHSLVMGGPMMGFSLPGDHLPVTKASNCILIGATTLAGTRSESHPCIRCGACAEVCPAKLLPQQLYWHARSKEFDKIQDFNLFDCIECGCCAYVCPSNLPLVQYYRYAKNEIWSQEKEKYKSDRARQRFEFRARRLEKQKRELEERRQRKKAALKKSGETATDKKQAIQDAIERVKQKQAGTTPASTDDKPES